MTTRPPPAFDRIGAVLRQTRRRLMARAGLRALGWLLASAGAAALFMWMLAGSGVGPGWIRAATVVVLGVAALVALAVHLVRPWWRARRDEAVAAHLEEGVPALHDGLLASVQFGREWPDRAPGSPAMVGALADQVARRLEHTPIAEVVPVARPARRAWGAVVGVGLAWGFFALVAPQTMQRGYAMLLPGAQPLGGREVGPLVGDLTLTLYFPLYTQRAPRTIPNSAGDFEAPKGTRVVVTATTLEPVQSALIRLGDAELPLTVTEQRDLSGEMIVSGPEAWRFGVVTLSGEPQIEGFERRVRVEVDKPPTVTLQLPAEDMELDDLRAVPVAFDTRDDFGLSKAAVVVALAADPDHPERIEQSGVSGKRFDGDDEVDLSVIQAQPGDRIALFVEAYDNNTVDGPQRGVSATRYITVNSPQQRHYELSERLRETIELLLTALADRLEVEWYDEQPPPIPARIAGLMASTDKAAGALATVVEQMADDPLTPEEVRLALAGRLGTLENAIAAEKQISNRHTDGIEARRDVAVRKVQKANEAIIEPLEETIILVEAMVARLALEDMAALADELQAARQKLKELVEQYKANPNDEALKARIMREIQRLRRRMQEMQARMAQLRQKLPEEFLNLDGLKKDEVAKGLKETQDQLSELEKMLEEGKIDEALAALDEMEQALDEMAAQLDQDMNDLHDQTNPEMQRAISELMDQTRDLMKRQKEVNEETEAMAEAEAEAQRKMLEEQMAERLKGIEQKAQKVRQNVEQVDPQRMPSIAGDELNHLQQRVDELNGALDRKALMEALEMAERSLDHLDNLSRYNRHSASGRENQRLIDESRDLDRQVADELSELLRQARQQARQRSNPQQSRQLAQRQRQVGEATQRLQQRMRDSSEKIPGLGDEPMQRIEQAEQSMRRAAQRLDESRPGQARPGQQQAMNELQGLMEGLKRATRPQRAERNQGRSRRMSQEKVKIPGEDEYEAPEAFRKDLLEAMKDKAPEDYREQVKRYYESLIR